MKPTMGSLFAGIGGFDLGFERAGFEIAWQVEIDPWCRQILAKNFPNAERYEDVRTVGAYNLKKVDVICGGFPCQDISNAGFGAGINGERSGLWREYARIICEIRPKYILIENVAALVGNGLSRVLCDLAEAGFDAEWETLHAGYFGAPHERERIWILAYANKKHGKEGVGTEQDWPRPLFAGSDCERFPIWLQAASEFIGMDDGLPARLYAPRVGALGNAVVPQIPEIYARYLMTYFSGRQAVEDVKEMS